MSTKHIAIDQYGHTVYLNSGHPRKELLDECGYKHADKMYCDTNGPAKHIGYVIGGRWFRIYKLEDAFDK